MSPFVSGKNFWIVVKTTPPDATVSSSPQVLRGLSACTGVCRRRSLQAANVPKS